MSPDQITIAVTVFDRRDYLAQAIGSALAQTLPVQVMVVDDCGPDPSLESVVRSQFGSRVSYHRNARRRGLFDNWNACVELCQTPWLCLVHDDDFLAPDFIEAMLQLAQNIPGQGLLYGQSRLVDSTGQVIEAPSESPAPEFRGMDLARAAIANPVRFPAELFRADYVRALGGFRAASLYTGDWDMWLKLGVQYGAARTSRIVGNSRLHSESETSRIERAGKRLPLVMMQFKRNLALVRQRGISASSDRQAVLQSFPIPTRFLLKSGAVLTPRMRRYYTGLLLQSAPPHAAYRFFKALAWLFGPCFVGLASRTYNAFRRPGWRCGLDRNRNLPRGYL
jgi:glycosyltransferase involved in cell wall biosynthesis